MAKATEHKLKSDEAEQREWDKAFGPWLQRTVIWPGKAGWKQDAKRGENWQAHVYGGARGKG